MSSFHKSVEVLFKDSKYNYKTTVNGRKSNKLIRMYFVHQKFDVGTYPEENLQECIDINILN